MKKQIPAILALEDGTIFRGTSSGAEGETSGEVVFNTSLYGYQEILTDPSYTGQMLTFTYPHIGNVGANKDDVESSSVHVRGVIMREVCDSPSSFRAEQSFPAYLQSNNVVGISGIDTRELVLHLRTHGSKMGVISTSETSANTLVDKAKKLPSMNGLDLVPNVSCEKPYYWKGGAWSLETNSYKVYSDQELASRPLVVALDFGVKNNILRSLTTAGFRVCVVPAKTSAEEICKLSPDAIFLSNGPGDPAAVTYGIETTKKLLGKFPTFGICLGHQILGLALGAPTFKLKFGHRGGNHPVKNILTGQVEISVQNHGFATDADKVPSGVEITHRNLNDNTVEGLQVRELNAFSVQYHPECSPGPHDSMYLFDEFYKRVVA